jgi:hypothetical protein
MEKQFATYEIALKLKELKFDEPCLREWYNGSLRIPEHNYGLDHMNTVDAPLWQQVIEWFTTLDIFISIYRKVLGSDEWEYSYCIEYLPNDKKDVKRRCLEFKSYDPYLEHEGLYSGAWDTIYEAYEKSILKAIKICQEK